MTGHGTIRIFAENLGSVIDKKELALDTGKTSDWVTYKKLRNKVNNMKKHAKETFFNTLEFTLNDLNSNNPRQYWKIVKMLMKENAKQCDIIPPLR